STIKLQQIKKELRDNHYEMNVAKRNLRTAESRLGRRLQQLYISGGQQDSMVGVLLGAQSLDDVINRLDTANRVSAEDAQVLRQVKKYRLDVATRGAALKKAHQAQQQIVAERSAAKSEIESGLAEHKRLYNSIKDQIVELQREAAARQALLA